MGDFFQLGEELGLAAEDRIELENDKREADAQILDGSIMGIEEASEVIKPCRYCELACPIAQGDSPRA